MEGKTWAVIILGVIVFAGVIQGLLVISCGYSRNDAWNAWFEVRNQYKRRYDLIPRLVNLTDKYLKYEQATLLAITEARTQWADALETDSIGDDIEAGDVMGVLVDNILMMLTVENYPTLKGDTVVLDMMDELAGTENRIAVARQRYNNAVRDYNNLLIITPLARMFGHHELSWIEYTEPIEEAPEVPA